MSTSLIPDERWTEQQLLEECPACHGSGRIERCARCRGTGLVATDPDEHGDD